MSTATEVNYSIMRFVLYFMLTRLMWTKNFIYIGYNSWRSPKNKRFLCISNKVKKYYSDLQCGQYNRNYNWLKINMEMDQKVVTEQYCLCAERKLSKAFPILPNVYSYIESGALNFLSESVVFYLIASSC